MDKLKELIKSLLNIGFIKYGMVGVVNTLITAIIIFILMNGLGINYEISNAIGYVAGFFNSFFLNKFWTFKSSESSTIKQFTRFTVVFLVCYLLQHGLLVFLVEKLLVNKNIATLVGMVFYTVIGFFFNKLFTFKK